MRARLRALFVFVCYQASIRCARDSTVASLGAASQFDSAPTDTERCHPEPVELLGARPKSARFTERDLVGPSLRMTRARGKKKGREC